MGRASDLLGVALHGVAGLLERVVNGRARLVQRAVLRVRRGGVSRDGDAEYGTRDE